jgi:hypothetical protein
LLTDFVDRLGITILWAKILKWKYEIIFHWNFHPFTLKVYYCNTVMHMIERITSYLITISLSIRH